MSFKTEKNLVYGDLGGTLLFFPRTRAHDFAQFCKARRQARTWGEFRGLMPPTLLDEIRDFDDDENPHADSANFDKEDPISIWWPFPQSDQVDFLPENVVALGDFSDTGEGDRVDFSTAQEDEIVRSLREQGYAVERDDALVRAATDY
jgi:hypothetical protein